MLKKAIVLGGSGFIGNAVIKLENWDICEPKEYKELWKKIDITAADKDKSDRHWPQSGCPQLETNL